ncbi:MAG: Nif11-like leader peptide family RiPP precursor [Thermoanaerobaculia bacterium]
MSIQDLDRFSAALRADPRLLEQLSALGLDAEAWRAHAASLGFHLTLDEARGLAESTTELSDEELEDVAGGWTGDPPPPGTGGGG